MSAFIVSNRTMSRALCAIEYAGLRSYDVRDSFLRQSLGNELFALNADAVAQRYREAAESITWQWEDVICSKPDAYKALECVIYQCSEGDVPERPLFKMLEDAAQRLAGEIISELPSYKAAAWDSHDTEPSKVVRIF